VKKLLAMALACTLGCNARSQDGFDQKVQNESPAIEESRKSVRTIIPVPDQNSEDAAAQFFQFIERSIPVKNDDPLITEWESPTQGIRIHLTAENKILIVDFFGQNLTGLGSIQDAIESTIAFGNQKSVLLTSETQGWKSPIKKKVVEIIFQPHVQVYLVGYLAKP